MSLNITDSHPYQLIYICMSLLGKQESLWVIRYQNSVICNEKICELHSLQWHSRACYMYMQKCQINALKRFVVFL